jgi:putative Mg2+ transporter-C (MgtC) family protein
MNFLSEPWHSFWLQIGTAMLCGGLIGLERQVRGKPAGIRTSILICLGTEVFVRLGTLFSSENADPTRVLSQVVTGVGFLGAGVILARGRLLTGVTSAAIVWVLAAIGATIGLGYYLEAIALAGITVAMLVVVRGLEAVFGLLRGGSDEAEPARRPSARSLGDGG